MASCSLPSGLGPPQTGGSSSTGTVSPPPTPWYPGQEEVTQEIPRLPEPRSQNRGRKTDKLTTESGHMGRAEGSVELWGWVAEKPHSGNADFEATSLHQG